MFYSHAHRLARRSSLVLIACLAVAAAMLGMRPPTARADDGVCAMGPYTLGVSGPNGDGLTQPPDTLVHLRIYTDSGDPLASSCGGQPLTFQWAYVDYFSGSGPDVAVAGSLDDETIDCTVTVHAGGVYLGQGQITLHYVDAGPSGTTIATTPTLPATGTATTLTALPSAYADGTHPDVQSSAWTFGDGGTATTNGGSISHVYRGAGDYTAAVTVTDFYGKTDTAEQVIHVSAPLVPALSLSSSTVGVGQTVHLDGSGSSTDPAATISAIAWDMGDGAHASGPTTDYAYAATGTYTVTETVTDSLGRTATATRDVTVQEAPIDAVPTAAFTAPASALAESVAAFDGSGSAEPGGSLAGYAWSFGDGGTGIGVAPTHTFAAPGTYPVTLTVTDGRGTSASVTHPVTVRWGAADLAVSVAGATPRSGQYTYRVTVKNLGAHAAHGVVLLNTLDATQLLASTATAPAGISCAGVRVGSTGTLTCKANAATALAAGKSWVVAFTVKQPAFTRARLVTETSQVKAANPDGIAANNLARLTTSVPRV